MHVLFHTTRATAAPGPLLTPWIMNLAEKAKAIVFGAKLHGHLRHFALDGTSPKSLQTSGSSANFLCTYPKGTVHHGKALVDMHVPNGWHLASVSNRRKCEKEKCGRAWHRLTCPSRRTECRHIRTSKYVLCLSLIHSITRYCLDFAN